MIKFFKKYITLNDNYCTSINMSNFVFNTISKRETDKKMYVIDVSYNLKNYSDVLQEISLFYDREKVRDDDIKKIIEF